MEDYIIYAIVIVAGIFILKKTFGKEGSCGCSGKSKCSKK